MTLTYESNLDDVSEPAIRHFLRSKTARNARFRSTISGLIVCAAAIIFIFRERDAVVMLIGGIVGAIFGATINYFTYVPTVTRRIRKHMERETEGKLPAETIYHFRERKLICDHLGTTIALSLTDLQRVTEDVERIEICFGSTGLCTIPLRAFESPEQKVTFLEQLNSEQGVVPNP